MEVFKRQKLAFPPSNLVASSSDDDISMNTVLSSKYWMKNKNKLDLVPENITVFSSTLVSEIPNEINISYDEVYHEVSCDKIPHDLKFSNNKPKEIWYDDDQSVPFFYEDCTVSTEQSSDVSSAGNASLDDTLEVYAMHEDEIGFNYRGPKVLPINETPVTICTANTIGCVRSRKLFRVLMDSGSSGCLIKRSALPDNVVPKTLQKVQHYNTLAGKISANEMVTLRDIRLPELDMHRRIEAQRY